jgi:hypothetical protein
MPGLLRGVARVAVASGTATAVSNRVSRRQADKWSQQQAPAYQEQPAPPPPAPVAAAPAPVAVESTVDQLKDLADLKREGILTEDEFAAQKAKILAG